MNDKIIEELEYLKQGGTFYGTKDQPQDVSEAIYKLTNLGVLQKNDRFKYTVKNIKHLSKVIELKSIDNFINWLNSESDINKNITTFNIDKVGQINNGDNYGNQSSVNNFTNDINANDNKNPTIRESKIWTTSNILFTVIMGLIVSFIFWWLIT